jgi:hypothetical protein
LLLALAVATAPVQAAEEFRQISWEALVPKGWDPAKEFKALDLGKLQDSDPKAVDALEKLKELWDNAPTEPSLGGAKVRIPGFAIPLERKGKNVTEFLLVPYFGACIHSPPPPANQIVHAVSKKPQNEMKTMDAIWVSGTLSLRHASTPWGAAGYRLEVERIAPYGPTKR